MRLILFSLFAQIAFSNFSSAQPVFMYPGDTNNDGKANHYDLLPIGIAYEKTGPPRNPATILWVLQQAEPWLLGLPVSQINLAFVDCDGMGIINSQDILAIALNYDTFQNNSMPPPTPYEPKLIDTCFSCARPGLLVTFNQNTVNATGELFAYVQLVYPPNTPSSAGALGIAFDVEYAYTNTIIDDLTQIFPDTIPDSRMYIVAAHKEIIASEILPSPGRVGFAAAGRGRNVLYETDTLLTLKLIITDMIIRAENDTFSLKISNILILDSLERVILLRDTVIGSALVLPTSSPQIFQPLVLLSPNPVREVLTLESPEASMGKIEVHNLTGGRVLSAEMDGLARFEMPVGSLPPGLWVAVVQTRKGVAVKKFVKTE